MAGSSDAFDDGGGGGGGGDSEEPRNNNDVDDDEEERTNGGAQLQGREEKEALRQDPSNREVQSESDAPYDEGGADPAALQPSFSPPALDTPRAPRPRLDSRDSRRSFVLYGPVVSSREGRPDHLTSVLSQHKLQVDVCDVDIDDVEAQQPHLLHRPATIAERGESLAAREEQEGEERIAAATDQQEAEEEESKFQASPAAAVLKQRKQHRLYQRISVLLAPQDPTRLVQVNLRNVSYNVPVQLDKHTKTTVVNQSVCYFAYEFFLRLASLCRRFPDTAAASNAAARRYQVKDVMSLFVPYENKTVLSGINLVLKPGKTYVVLGPPGSGKTSLLQAISGRLPDHKSSLTGQPVKGRPHLQGRIEYNGVTVEVNISIRLFFAFFS
jgi:hypothetical protein